MTNGVHYKSVLACPYDCKTNGLSSMRSDLQYCMQVSSFQSEGEDSGRSVFSDPLRPIVAITQEMETHELDWYDMCQGATLLAGIF